VNRRFFEIPVGLRYMAAAAFFFSVMSLLVKLAGQRLPTMEVVLVRSFITLALSYAVLRRAGIPLWGTDRRLLVVRGMLGFVALSCFYYALIHLPIADATVIQYTNPVFTVLIAAVVLAERVGRREITLALVSLGGVVMIARPTFLFGGNGAALPPLAVGVALAGAIFSAAAYVTVRRLGRTEQAMVIVFYFSLISTILSFPMMIPVYVHPAGSEWLVLLGVGVTTQLGQVCLTHGLKRERAGRAMNVGYLQIVFATLWGVIIFAEIPDRWTLAGALVIVATTWLLVRARPALPSGDPMSAEDDAGPAGDDAGPGSAR
jgi:drug/metabolite transporter (DMT)-like permease